MKIFPNPDFLLPISMKRLTLLATLLFLLCNLCSLHAEEIPRANAEQEAAVRALLGQKATITGKVTDVFESPKGMTLLNLEGGKCTVVAWKDSYDKFEGGSPSKLYRGKTVAVTGEIFEFHPKGASKQNPGKLEIKLNSPEQIKILTAKEPEGETKDASPKKPARPVAPKNQKEPSVETKKDPKANQAEKPTVPTQETKSEPDKESPERVDPKKYFK